jgi:hypothetical protein
MVSYASNTEEEEQSKKGDEKDADDKNDERDEKETESIDKDYLGIHSTLHFVVVEKCDWNFLHDQTTNHPILEIQVPPPKGDC